MNIRHTLAKLFQRFVLGRHIHHYWPTTCRLFDEQQALVPRSTARALKNWRAISDQVQEGEKVLAAYEGGDFIDIGAFQGIYELLLAPKARTGDRFVALEPDARAYRILLSNLAVAAQQYPEVNFLALPLPVGEGENVRINFPAGESGHPQFLATETGGQSARSVSIDALVQSIGLEPKLMKIDVEGAEFSVLRGAASTLETFRPTLMLEIHRQILPDDVSVEQIERFLHDRGYTPNEINFSHALWTAT